MIILRLIAILCSIIVIFLSGWNLSRIYYLEEKLDAMDAFNKGYLEGLQDGSMFFQNEDEPHPDCPKTCPSIDICTKDDADCAWK